MKFLTGAAAWAAFCILGGCATVPAARHDVRDPLERVNRGVYRFNVAADHAVFRPAARAWKTAVPAPLRHGLANFVDNLAYPVTMVNEMLQGKLHDGGDDFVRLLVNSVAGLGFFDPATHLGLDRHDEDFGQTLGKWGLPAGPYLMLPLLGPSTLRDAPSMLADEYANGRHYIADPYVKWGLWTTSKLELRAGLLEADAVLERTYDPYAFVRSAWLQRREYQVRDGQVDEPAPDSNGDPPPADDAPPAGDAPPGDRAAPGGSAPASGSASAG